MKLKSLFEKKSSLFTTLKFHAQMLHIKTFNNKMHNTITTVNNCCFIFPEWPDSRKHGHPAQLCELHSMPLCCK